MPEYLAPAVYVEETSFRSKSIEGVGTSTTGFVGMTCRGPVSTGTGPTPPLLTSFSDFERYYGGVDNLSINGNAATNYLAQAVLAFFNNGGGRLYVARVLGAGAVAATSGSLNSGGGPPAANEQIAIAARFPGGATLPDRTGVNFSVRLVQSALATTKRLALRQRPGTLVQQGTDFYVMGSPVLTSAANLNAWDALGDDAPATILSLGVEVTGPTGVVAEYA